MTIKTIVENKIKDRKGVKIEHIMYMENRNKLHDGRFRPNHNNRYFKCKQTKDSN